MKKSVFFLTLLLCLSLIFPGAHAEDTYVPGERMRSLVSSALEDSLSAAKRTFR